MNTTITYAERRARTIDLINSWQTNPTSESLAGLAVKYEENYRQARASKSSPSKPYLLGMLQTARVFYSLSREMRAATLLNEVEPMTVYECIRDAVRTHEASGDAAHIGYIISMVRAQCPESVDEIHTAVFELVLHGALVEVGKDLYESALTVGDLMSDSDPSFGQAETMDQIRRREQEQRDAEAATQRGRPWTPKEFAVGHALPHQFR